MDGIGQEAGEYFERILELIFKAAGFATERDKHFPGALRHEVDVWAVSSFGNIAVEGKDWRYVPPATLKKELGEFRSKVRDTGAITGVFAVNLRDTGQFQRHRDYMRQSGLFFWDIGDLENWYNKIGSPGFQKALCDSLGLSFQPPARSDKIVGLLKSEKMSDFLKKAGRLAYKSAVVTADIAQQLGIVEERPRRRRCMRSSKAKRSSPKRKRRAS